MLIDKFDLDPNLEEFASEQQWARLLKWAELGSAAKAAEHFGVNERVITQARSRVLAKAARRGYAPEYGDNPPKVPKGFVLRGVSTLRNADGTMRYQWDKTKQAAMDPEEAFQLPDPKKVIKVSTYTDNEGRVIGQWKSEKPEDIAKEHAWEEFARELADSLPRPRLDPLPAPTIPARNENMLAGFPISDHHMGMLAWHMETGASYDLKIGESLLRNAMDYLTRATAGCGTALIAFLGDFLHYDSFVPETPTSHNKLDSDTRFPKMSWLSVTLMRAIIDTALSRHGKVHVIVETGNHDLGATPFLGLCLKIAYENEPRVTIDASPQHYHYYRFGKVLLATHHGHGAKMDELPSIMASDVPDEWAASVYRHWWTGHIHHAKTKAALAAQDYRGCTVESFRVMPPPDAWAHQKGYRPYRDLKAFMFDRDFGEQSRFTVTPAMLEGLVRDNRS